MVRRIETEHAGTAETPGAVDAWEPCLRLDPLAIAPVLYEPEGPIYAVCLGPSCEVATDRRRVTLATLDLIVVAPGLAVDLTPPALFLVLRHLGTPPPHFRERFVQVWGFEHRPATEGPVVLDPEAAGHRLGYTVYDLSGGSVDVSLPPHTMGVLVTGDGATAVVSGDGVTPPLDLPSGAAALVEPGTSCVVSGTGGVGLLTALPEVLHEARALARRQRGEAARVDYSPPSRRPDAPGSQGE